MQTLADFQTRNLLLDQGSPEELRAKLLDYFETTYTLYEKLFESFKSKETFYVRPESLRHPHIFYYGHTSTFYINKLNIGKYIDRRVNPTFESMFAIGVDEMSWDDLSDENYDWPDVDDVQAYRDEAREVVREFIQTAPLEIPLRWNDPLWVVLMGIEHERIHIETSSVLVRQTDLQHLNDTGFWPINTLAKTDPRSVPSNSLLPVPGGEVHIGKEREHNQYGWDNEYGTFDESIAPFHASKFLVSNAEFLEFVEEGGYHDTAYWTREGRQWLEFKKPEHPVFWIKDAASGTYRYRAMLKETAMPWDWPVDVNYLEAKAFCNWKSERTGKKLRLPTEAEWYRLLNHTGIPDEPYWDKAPGNINLEYGASACPIDRFSFKDGFCDVVGNVWQWCETPIDKFEGFEIHPLYDDFSVPTFDNKHNLIKGGSWISTGNEANRHSRYAFRRHFYQHAGFRYVEAGENPYEAVIEASNSAIYETDALLSQYCEFHYGDEYFGVPNFARRCAEVCLEYMKNRPKKRALDIGCAVGRTSFELAKEFEFVNGLDFTARFIRLGIELQEQGKFHYQLPTEGELMEEKDIVLDDLDLCAHADRVEFWQGDASNLKPQFKDYDLIFAGNLIDRMYQPEIFLSTVHERLNDKGLFILASPYTWLEEFTKKENWIGGYYEGKTPVTTMDGLKRILGAHFTLIAEPFEIPMVIRETRHKYQHTLSEVTVWEKK